MAYLVDTSVLARLANVNDTFFGVAAHAISELHRRGEALHITPQNLIELRAVVTRPTSVNGLGMSAADAEALASTFERRFALLPDTPLVYPAWKQLAQQLQVVGKQVHDLRLVAVCQVHGVDNLLTFNTAHFNRLCAAVPGLQPVDPAAI